MKLPATVFALVLFNVLFGQITTPMTTPNVEVSLVSITPKQHQEIEGVLPNDEGTNDPTVTGSTVYIQGDQRYYIKSNEQITIIYEEKKP